MQKKDNQIQMQEKFIVELTETIEEQKSQIAELQQKFNCLRLGKVPEPMSAFD